MNRRTRGKLSDLLLKTSRKRSSASAVLHIGDIGILKKNPVGFACSTRCPGEAILQIYDAARFLRDNNCTIVSRFRTPMEIEVLNVLLRGEQAIVMCADNNEHALHLADIHESEISKGRMLVVFPDQAFSAAAQKSATENQILFSASICKSFLVGHAEVGSDVDFALSKLRARKILTMELSTPSALGFANPIRSNLLPASR